VAHGFCAEGATATSGEVTCFAPLTTPEPAAQGGSEGLRLAASGVSRLPEERYGWALDAARVAQAASGACARPLDLFPAGCPAELGNAVLEHLSRVNTQVVPARWQLPDGRCVLLNTRDLAQLIEGTLVPARSVHVGAAPSVTG
jgi:hypothetical protein